MGCFVAHIMVSKDKIENTPGDAIYLKNSLQGAFLSCAPCSFAYCSHWEMASITWSPPDPREDT